MYDTYIAMANSILGGDSNFNIIDDLKGEIGVTDDQLRQKCDPDHLRKTAVHVKNYVGFGEHVGIPVGVISGIENQMNPRLEYWQKTEAMFLWWYNNCRNPTYEKFAKIYLGLFESNVAKTILQLLVDGSSPRVHRSSSLQTVQATPNNETERVESGFVCPYCRNCTIKAYFTEGCPEAEGETLFPYLDIKALSKHEQCTLEQKLYKETDNIVEAFACIDNYVLSNLTEPVAEIKSFVLLLHVLDIKNDTDIKKAANISDLFVALTPYKSFLNYSILEKIVNQFGTQEMKSKMVEYLAKLDKFCERSAFEIPERCLSTSSTLVESSRGKIISVKVIHGSRIRDAVLARIKMASIFGVDQSVFLILAIHKGCMCVRFLVSRKVFLKYFPPSASQLAALKEAGIEIITAPTHFKRSASEGDLTLLSTASAVLGDDDSGLTLVEDSKISAKHVAKYQHLKTNKRSIKMMTLRNWTVWLKKNIQQLRQDPGHMVPLLLWYCIDECDTDFGWTATHGFAASSESLGMEVMYPFFEFLRKCNQKIQILTKDKDGDIPVQSAIRSKASKDIIERLIDVKNVNDLLCSRNNKNQNPLLTAFDESHWEAVEVILGKCIEHNLLSELTGVRAPPGHKHNTILHKAFERRNVEYFKIFLKVCNDKGITHEELTAAVLVSNRRNVTPWYYAIRFLNIEELKTVLTCIKFNSLGLDINSLYTDEETRSTMLHEAYRVQSDERCCMLEDYGGAKPRMNKRGLFPHDRDHQIQGHSEQAAVCIEGDSVSESGVDLLNYMPVPDQAGCIEVHGDILIQRPRSNSGFSDSSETSTESFKLETTFTSCDRVTSPGRGNQSKVTSGNSDSSSAPLDTSNES